MKRRYSRIKDRAIRQEMANSRPYESRASLRRKYDITQKVNKIRRKVNKGYSFNGIDTVVDKYYIPSHYPPRDVLTELGQVEAKKSKISLLTLAAIILGLVLLSKKA